MSIKVRGEANLGVPEETAYLVKVEAIHHHKRSGRVTESVNAGLWQSRLLQGSVEVLEGLNGEGFRL